MVLPCLGNGVTRDGKESEGRPHDGHEPGAYDDVGLRDVELHDLEDGGDARHDQGRADEVLGLLVATRNNMKA